MQYPSYDMTLYAASPAPRPNLLLPLSRLIPVSEWSKGNYHQSRQPSSTTELLVSNESHSKICRGMISAASHPERTDLRYQPRIASPGEKTSGMIRPPSECPSPRSLGNMTQDLDSNLATESAAGTLSLLERWFFIRDSRNQTEIRSQLYDIWA